MQVSFRQVNQQQGGGTGSATTQCRSGGRLLGTAIRTEAVRRKGEQTRIIHLFPNGEVVQTLKVCPLDPQLGMHLVVEKAAQARMGLRCRAVLPPPHTCFETPDNSNSGPGMPANPGTQPGSVDGHEPC